MGVFELTSAIEHIVSVFGSSRPQERDPEYKLAYDVGQELARAGFIVCNGGYGGIMEASARGAKSAGGKTLGVVADYFSKQPNQWIDSTVAKKTLVDRMMELISRAHGYVILKGGTGTLLEFAAVWELMNKTVMPVKPIVVVGEFWNEVVETLKGELAWEGLDNCTKYVTIVRSASECASTIKQQLQRSSNE